MRVLVTGGGGFLGRRTINLLASQLGEDNVFATDWRFPSAPSSQQFLCDIRDADAVHRLLEQVRPAVVVHLASYGMSGAAQLQQSLVRDINVGGTRNVVAACEASPSCRALVYMSTYNVVFGGQEIVAGDESLPVLVSPDERLVPDFYSVTKAEAETLVLARNGPALWTTSLRPAAIYGDGEERHTPRMIRVVNQGLGFIAVGDPTTLCDWVYVDNLATAVSLAIDKAAAGDDGVCGNAFFISDGKPVHTIAIQREMLGSPTGAFSCYVPTSVMLLLARLSDVVLQGLCRVGITLEPFLTSCEVVKVGVTHFMSIDKARTRLGYSPVVSPSEAVSRTANHFRSQVLALDLRIAGAVVRVLLPVVVVLLVLWWWWWSMA